MKTPQEWMKQTSPPLYGSAIDRWIEAIQKDAFESGRVAGLEEAHRPQLIACTKCGKSMRKDDGFVDALRKHHICFDCMTKELNPKDTCSKNTP